METLFLEVYIRTQRCAYRQHYLHLEP